MIFVASSLKVLFFPFLKLKLSIANYLNYLFFVIRKERKKGKIRIY